MCRQIAWRPTLPRKISASFLCQDNVIFALPTNAAGFFEKATTSVGRTRRRRASGSAATRPTPSAAGLRSQGHRTARAGPGRARLGLRSTAKALRRGHATESELAAGRPVLSKVSILSKVSRSFPKSGPFQSQNWRSFPKSASLA